jgi:hypothetical protein
MDSAQSVASAAASIATGWSEPVPGWELHPLKFSAFHGALLRLLPWSIFLRQPPALVMVVLAEYRWSTEMRNAETKQLHQMP